MARTNTRFLPIREYLQNEIRMRYAPKSILPYADNEVLHKLVEMEPTIPAASIREMNIMNDNIVQMSYQLLMHKPAAPFGLPESFTSEYTQKLLDELNIRPTVEDLQAIKNQNIKLCVVGYGGAMINMLYNMYLWSMELSVTKIFEKIVIFEKDTLDFSNIPRIGKPMVSTFQPDYLQSYDEDVNNIKLLNKPALINEEAILCKNNAPIILTEFLNEPYANKVEESGYIFVGAPTLDTRAMLQDKPFYFFGHGDFEVEIQYQPPAASGLAVETYGTIDIPALLVNFQLATAAFIKQLARGETPQSGEVVFNFDINAAINEALSQQEEAPNV